MKRLLLLSFVFAAFSAKAQQFKFISGTSETCDFSYKLEEAESVIKTIDGVNYMDYQRMYNVVSLEKSAPAVPLFHTTLHLPAKGNPIVTVTYDNVTEIQDVNVLPSKGNLKRNVDPASVPYTFGPVYGQDAFYPSAITATDEPFVWGKTRGITITIAPFQYNPVTKTLRIHTNLKVRVDYNEAVSGANETAISEFDGKFMEQQKKQFLDFPAEKYTAIGEEGSMLVIAPSSYTDALKDFIDWKRMKGMEVTLATTTQTGSSDTQIKSYIQDYYSSNPDLMYILLVGDHEQVPAHTYGLSEDGEQLWSDSYYGQLAGGASDFHPEAFVGRFPAANVGQVTLMANRSVEYERNPAFGTWSTKAIGLASSEGTGIGDDNEIDFQHLRNIRTKLVNFGYTDVYELYEGSQGGADAPGNPSWGAVAAAINDGAGFMNYTGHGSATTFMTSGYGSTQANNATNNGMYPFVVSVACNNGTFANANCLAEAFLRSENNGTPAGSIGFAGSSILMSWAPPMQTQDELADIITGSSVQKQTIGGLFYNAQLSMLEEYPNVDGEAVMQTWILFADPSTDFRSKVAADLFASQIPNVPLGTTSLVVNCNLEGTVVAVSQSHELIGKAVVSGGQATITFDALTEEVPLTVIATKQNFRPYLASVQVGNSTLSLEEQNQFFSIYPNPANDYFIIDAELQPESIEMYDLLGAKVAIDTMEEGNRTTVQTGTIAAGSYVLRIVTASGTSVQRVEITK